MAEENQTQPKTEIKETKFWISGINNGEFVECDGPYTTTKELPKEDYPYVAVQPNPNFQHQKYDYVAHAWVDASKEAVAHDVATIKTTVAQLTKTTDDLKEDHQQTIESNKNQDKKSDKMMGLLNLLVKQMGAVSHQLEVQNTVKDTAAKSESTESNTAKPQESTEVKQGGAQ